MKVGIVAEYYFPYLGGIAEHVHYTYKHFIRQGVKAKIITPFMSGMGCTDERPDWWAPESDIIRIARSYPYYINGGFVRFSSPLGLARRLRRVLEKEGFDLLHVHTPLAPMLPLYAVRVASCPVVGVFHTAFKKSTMYVLFRPYLTRLVKKMKGCIAVSPYAAEAYGRYFEVPFTIIPNGVDVETYTPSAPPLKEFKANGIKNILFVGRFDPHNGLPVLLDAFVKVKEKYKDCRLIVVGDGPLAPVYRKLVPTSLSRDVCFTGPQHALKPNFYATADLFCNPALRHSFSIVSLEAMATAVPVVASDLPAFRWLMKDDAAYFPAGDSSALAQRLLELLADRNTRILLGERSRARALLFSWDRIASQIISYLRAIQSVGVEGAVATTSQWSINFAGNEKRLPHAVEGTKPCSVQLSS